MPSRRGGHLNGVGKGDVYVRVPAHEEGREGDDGLHGKAGPGKEVLYDRETDDEEGGAVCLHLIGRVVAGGHEDLCRGGREEGGSNWARA